MERMFERVISADSHMMEPMNLWWDALGSKYGDTVPRLLEEHNGEKGRFFFNGSTVRPVGGSEGDAEARYLMAAGYDPEVRVKFQLEAEVESELLHPTRLASILHHPDPNIMLACCQVYNDWMADFASHDQKRFLAGSVVPMGDIGWAERELERVAKKGARTAAISLEPPDGCPPYRNSAYDRFWSITEDMEIPLTLHIFMGKPRPHFDALPPERQDENAEILLLSQYEITWVLARDFIFGTILDRFPRMQIIDSEFEVGWIPFFNWWLDRFQNDWGHRMKMPDLKIKASDYMRKRIWHGFIDDPQLSYALSDIGADHVLWGSDFPHIRSLGLDTHERLPGLLEGLTQEQQQSLISSNAIRLWDL